MTRDGRPDPDKLLRQVQAEQRDESRGRLKTFLGYASGVGKSYRMFDEARRRGQRRQDVVIASTQFKLPPEAEALLATLEVIPHRVENGLETMDLDAVLRRHPEVCVVDGLAYDNPAGSRHAKRWMEVEELLKCGISVLTSINLQFVEEYSERVHAVTGKTAKTTVPVGFIQSADEIVIVDAPPEFCLHRAEEFGDPGLRTQLEQQLSHLRELALLLAADVVDRQLAAFDQPGTVPAWGTQERLLVCVTSRANAEQMLASAKRNAERFHGELYAVYVTQPEISPEDQAGLENNLSIARRYGAKVEIIDNANPIDAIMEFARSHAITQIYVGHSRRQDWISRWTGTPLDRLIEAAENMDVRVFPH